MTTKNTYEYTPARVKSLWTSMSTARLDRYKSLAGGDEKDALELYCWNLALSQAFYWPLHTFEVTLRNALAEKIKARYGNDWFNSVKSFSSYRGPKPNKEVEHIDKAKSKLSENAYSHSHDNIVAASTLGFWHGLFKGEYEKSLYEPLFSQLFEVNNREEAYRKIQQVKHLRNNIAHYEPIIVDSYSTRRARELYKDYKVIMKIIRWLNADTVAWVESRSSAHFFKTWNNCPSFFTILPLTTIEDDQESNSDRWRWFTPTESVKR